MHRGYLVVWRKFFEDHPFWREKRKFSKAEAWIDILRNTHFLKTPQARIINGRNVTIGYGQCILTVRYCAKRWGWNPSVVHRFFELLKKMGQIRTDKEQQMTRISVINFDKYDLKQNTDQNTMRDTGRTAAEQQQNELKNYNNIRIRKTSSADFEKFWNAYPRKANKGHTRYIWEQMIGLNSLPDLKTILDSIELQKNTAQWLANDGQFIPNPSTWLNAEGWNNVPGQTKRDWA